jgi:hypothetical protein
MFYYFWEKILLDGKGLLPCHNDETICIDQNVYYGKQGLYYWQGHFWTYE